MGATSRVPAILDALYDRATEALSEIRVSDGRAPTVDPGDFLLLGVDLFDASGAQAADSRQEFLYVGGQTRRETGEIFCTALSWNGDDDLKAARDGVYGTAAALEDFLRADPTLGLDFIIAVEFGTQQRFDQDYDDDGATAVLTFRIAYSAHI